ncbi:unnamed protein product, partial [marine sediment metagenome]
MNIDQFRQTYPQYDTVPDAELASRLHRKFYADKLDFTDFADKFGVTVAPVERGFLGKLAESYRRGKGGTLADVAVYEAANKGLADEETVLRKWKDSRAKDYHDPIDSNLLGDMIYGGSRLMGQWGQSLKRGGVGAMVLGGLGAGIGAGVGALIPTVGEEGLTTAVGAKVGLKAGMKLGLAEGSAMF